MSIKQFNSSYIPNEDRLIFRFNTAEDQEYRFWFTRRVTLFILAATDHLVEKKLQQQHEKSTAKAIAQFQQEVHKEQFDIETEYQVANNYPIGADPVLVMEVNCALIQVDNVDVFSLDLVLPGNGNLNLKLPVPTVQKMRFLLERLAAQANWGRLQLNLTDVQEASPLDESDAIRKLDDPKKNFH